MMGALREQVSLLKAFLRSDFKKFVLGCALGMIFAIALGVLVGLLSPEAVERSLQFFTEMVEAADIVDVEGNLSVFGLLTNNWRAMLTTAVWGFLPFVFLPAVSLAANGFLIGVLAAWYHANGISMVLYLAGLLPHGILELPALILSAACGVRLCRNMCLAVTSSPKRVPMVELLSDLLRVLLFLVAPMTVAAAFLEAYVTPLVMSLFL